MENNPIHAEPAQYSALSEINSFSSFYKFLQINNIPHKGKRFIHIEMDISNKCNLQCKMCYNSLKKYRDQILRIITTDEFLLIAESIFDYTDTLIFGLGNEPLLSPNLINHLEVSSKYCIPNVIIQTSGDLLNDKLIESIFKYGLSEIHISIDAAKKNTYEKIRKGAKFDRLIDNIKKIYQYKKKYSLARPLIRFNVVLMKSNIMEMPALVQLAADYHISQINFCHAVLYKGLNMKNESLFFYKEESNIWLKKALELAKIHKITVVNHPQFFEIDNKLKHFKITKKNIKLFLKKSLKIIQNKKLRRNIFNQKPYCMFPFFHLSINSGLHVLSCPFAHGKKNYATISAENTLEKIWFGKKFQKLRANILNSNPPTQCLKCSYLSIQNPEIKSFFKPRKP